MRNAHVREALSEPGRAAPWAGAAPRAQQLPEPWHSPGAAGTAPLLMQPQLLPSVLPLSASPPRSGHKDCTISFPAPKEGRDKCLCPAQAAGYQRLFTDISGDLCKANGSHLRAITLSTFSL